MTPEVRHAEGQIPALTLGWRMQMALRHAGVSMLEMADELGVTRETCGRWTHDRGAPPRAAFLKVWALGTGVPYRWLAYGEAENPHADDQGRGCTCDAAVRSKGSTLRPPGWAE